MSKIKRFIKNKYLTPYIYASIGVIAIVLLLAYTYTSSLEHLTYNNETCDTISTQDNTDINQSIKEMQTQIEELTAKLDQEYTPVKIEYTQSLELKCEVLPCTDGTTFIIDCRLLDTECDVYYNGVVYKAQPSGTNAGVTIITNDKELQKLDCSTIKFYVLGG